MSVVDGVPGHVAIVGAGPVGLDAALAAHDRGWSFTVYEAAPSVGGNVRSWGHVRLFTPWELNVSDRMRAHLSAAGVEVPAGADYPTGGELVERLLEPVAALPEIAANLRLGTRVESVGREGLLKHEEIATDVRGGTPFRLLVTGPDGTEGVEHADLVLDCSGSYANPNMLGDGGIPAPGERAVADRITRKIPRLDAGDWGGRTVLLAGAGKSAQTVARDLAQLAETSPQTRVVWAVRNSTPDWGAIPNDTLPQRQELVDVSERLRQGSHPSFDVRTGVAVDRLSERDGRVVATLRAADRTEEVEVDHVVALTGFVPDAGIYRQLQVHECYATGAPITLSAALLGDEAADCLDQDSHGVDVLRSPEPNFFILGMKSYGRVSSFLLKVGYQQVDEVVNAYAPAR
ncbi:MAG: NAD(P)-binding protein [Actinomycetota bacterium]|nr:NAD(P)-binding protein [Actinomycetota bacterium]